MGRHLRSLRNHRSLRPPANDKTDEKEMKIRFQQVACARHDMTFGGGFASEHVHARTTERMLKILGCTRKSFVTFKVIPAPVRLGIHLRSRRSRRHHSRLHHFHPLAPSVSRYNIKIQYQDTIPSTNKLPEFSDDLCFKNPAIYKTMCHYADCLFARSMSFKLAA
jgi:hypothetical protein